MRGSIYLTRVIEHNANDLVRVRTRNVFKPLVPLHQLLHIKAKKKKTGNSTPIDFGFFEEGRGERRKERGRPENLYLTNTH